MENYYEQLSLFENSMIEKKITNPVRLISFFSGIEAQFKALSYLGKVLHIPVESYKTCEWAYNSIVACNAIHNRDFTDYSANKTKEEMIERIRGISINYNEPLSDEQLAKKPLKWIKKAYNSCIANHNLINIMNVHASDLEIVDNSEYEYITTYSYPCQDLSLAGKRAGMAVSQAEGGTRSGLLWEVERIITECHELGYKHMPNILVMENVPQVHSEKDFPYFQKWIDKLFELGYTSYYTDLNASDYGIPQNRKRCFMVSILKSPENKEYLFRFPAPIKRNIKLKDFLEEKIDQKYYLSQAMIDYLTGINQIESKYNRTEVFIRNLDPNKDIACTITTAAGQRATDNFVVEGDLSKIDYIPIRNATKKGYLEARDGDGINIGGRMKYQRGNVQQGACQTLKTSIDVGVCLFEGYDKDIRQVPNLNGFRIRKLTPKETNRLMAFTDEDYTHMREVPMTDGQIFHVNGDSIVVTVMIAIFAKLFGLNNNEIEKAINDYIVEICSDFSKMKEEL